MTSTYDEFRHMLELTAQRARDDLKREKDARINAPRMTTHVFSTDGKETMFMDHEELRVLVEREDGEYQIIDQIRDTGQKTVVAYFPEARVDRIIRKPVRSYYNNMDFSEVEQPKEKAEEAPGGIDTTNEVLQTEWPKWQD